MTKLHNGSANGYPSAPQRGDNAAKTSPTAEPADGDNASPAPPQAVQHVEGGDDLNPTMVTRGIRNARRYAPRPHLPPRNEAAPFGIDTVRLRFDGFDEWEAAAHHGLTVSPAPLLSPQDVEARITDGKPLPNNQPLFRCTTGIVEGWQAKGATDTVQAFVRPGGQLIVQTSLPRLIREHNLVPAWGEEELATVEVALAAELAELGIFANLPDAILTRVDTARNVGITHPMHAYVPMLKRRLREARQEPKGEYPTTYVVGNGTRRTRFYGKNEELATQGVDVNGHPPRLRAEHEVGNARPVAKTYGIGTWGQLRAAPVSVVNGYQKQMGRLFKAPTVTEPHSMASTTDTDAALILTPEKAVAVFEESRRQHPRGWYDKGLAAIALAFLEKQGAVGVVQDAAREVGGRQAAYRARKHRDDLASTTATVDAEIAETERLYAEVRDVLLSPVEVQHG